MAEIYFVRTETLPELPPPVAERYGKVVAGKSVFVRDKRYSAIVALWAVYKFWPLLCLGCGWCVNTESRPPAATFWTAPEARVFLC